MVEEQVGCVTAAGAAAEKRLSYVRLDVLSSVKPGHLSKLCPALLGYYGVIEKRPSTSFTVASPCVVVTTITAVSTENKLRL